MIWSALKEKFASRDPFGFASDAGELALACVYVGACSLVMAGAAVVVAVVGTPLLVLELLAGTEEATSSTDDGAPCRNGEDAP